MIVLFLNMYTFGNKNAFSDKLITLHFRACTYIFRTRPINYQQLLSRALVSYLKHQKF